jgi:hypothetical protein
MSTENPLDTSYEVGIAATISIGFHKRQFVIAKTVKRNGN